MKRIFITLISNLNAVNNNLLDYELRFSDGYANHDSTLKGTTRTSPMFCTDDSFNLFTFDSKKVILLYTLNPYNIVAEINRLHLNEEVTIFLTHGLASLLIFSNDKDYCFEELLLSKLNEETRKTIIGTEEWLINDRHITSYDKTNMPKFANCNTLKLEIEKLPIHDVFLFEELLIAYNYFDLYARTYLPQYICLSDSTKFLIKKIYKDVYSCVDKDDYDSSLELSSAREELLQTTATLKAVNTQAFNGINILSTNSIVRSGRDSLFGIGLCYYSVFQLYNFCRNKFTHLTFDSKKLATFLHKNKAPYSFIDIKDNSYIPSFNRWKEKINNSSDFASIDDLYNGSQINESGFYHLIHFSHRYGYREAKLSISLAKQCIPIGVLPSWGLNTFFHELLHSHVRLLLSSLDMGNATDAINYVLQPNARIYNHDAKSLKEFLQISIYDCIKNFIYQDALSSSRVRIEEQAQIEPEELKQGFQYCSDLINEIMVHTLDFHYFYNSDPDLYVKSIWMSWLLLPATNKRIEEYILRTICAIGTRYLDTDYKKVFDVSINKIEQSLSELKKYCFLKDSQIDNVISYIHSIRESENIESRNIKTEYQNYWGKLAFVTYKFLYSNKLQSSFDYSENLEVDFSEEYSIPLSIGEFIPVKYKNPIKIIQQNLILFFEDNKNLNKEVDYIESRSIWLHSILSSTYF